MTKQDIGASARAVTILVAVSNILSFSLGVAFVAQRSSRPRPLHPEDARTVATAAEAAGLYGSHAAVPPLPIAGKGMWIWQFDRVGHANPALIVRYALSRGLSHLYIRAGSSIDGVAGWRDIARVLPVAHAAGLKVIAWDFPYLRDLNADVRRARWILGARVGGQKVDGFAADVETKSEGTVLTRYTAGLYATRLRAHARGEFLVLVPPRPNPYTTSFYPYDVLIPSFDAIAPMIYWGRQAPAQATAWAMAYLRRFGKPVAPIGQTFDMGPWGGPKGPPQGSAVVSFMNEAKTTGAVGVSFWSWQHTPTRLWRTIASYAWSPASD